MRGRTRNLLSQSEFGNKLKQLVIDWDKAIQDGNQQQEIYCSDLWDMCKSALEFYEQEKFDFVIGINYCGIYASDYDQWIVKIEKGR